MKCRSFYFDLALLEDYWTKRKYHHTMSSALVYALDEALAIVEEEGLDVRWARHERNRAQSSALRTALKRVRTATTAEQAGGAYQTASRLLDRAARKNLIHPNTAAAVAKCVTMKALLARGPALSALPALKPNQPTHSRHAPITLSTTLCGRIDSLG